MTAIFTACWSMPEEKEILEDLIVAAHGEPGPLGADPCPGWQRVALGRVETEAGAVLLLDIGALIAGPEESLAA